MFFKKKSRQACNYCSKEIEEKFIYCPYCGKSSLSPEQIQKEFGLLGNSDEELLENPMAAAGLLSQMIAPMMQGLAKSFMEQMSEEAEIQQLPNGISIRMSSVARPKKRQPQKSIKPEITKEQIEKMADLPRATAKTKIRRLSDRVVYDLSIPGIDSLKDIFVSKTESGYEVKVLSKNKVYVNNLPINLPLRQYSFNEDGLSMEFVA